MKRINADSYFQLQDFYMKLLCTSIIVFSNMRIKGVCGPDS